MSPKQRKHLAHRPSGGLIQSRRLAFSQAELGMPQLDARIPYVAAHGQLGSHLQIQGIWLGIELHLQGSPLPLFSTLGPHIDALPVWASLEYVWRCTLVDS